MTRNQINIRIDQELLARLDAWIEAQPVSPTRTATIEAALEAFLGADGRTPIRYIGPDIASDVAMAEIQGNPRDALWLYFDWERRTIDLWHRSECELNSWTAREHDGLAYAVPLAPLSLDDWRSMLQKVRRIAAVGCAAYKARQSEVLDNVKNDLLRVAETARRDAVGGIWDAADYFEAEPPVVAADATDAEIGRLTTELQEQAHGDGVHLHDLEEYLTWLRDEAAEDDE